MFLIKKIEKYFNEHGESCAGKYTWRECVDNPDLLPKGNYIYLVFSPDSSTLYPVYIGSTRYGAKRIRQHAKGYGCMQLKHIMECSSPETDNFHVYFYRISKYILRSVEYYAQRYFNPWVRTPIGAGISVRGQWTDEIKRGESLPEYIRVYKEEIKINTQMMSDEDKRHRQKWEKELAYHENYLKRLKNGEIKPKPPEPTCAMNGCEYLPLRGEIYCAVHITEMY